MVNLLVATNEYFSDTPKPSYAYGQVLCRGKFFTCMHASSIWSGVQQNKAKTVVPVFEKRGSTKLS